MARILTILIVMLLSIAAPAAEFDIDSGRTVLRRLQYCTHCGSALLVTTVYQGTIVRCPDCGHEQPRIADRYLLTQLYQLCRLCDGPLGVEGRNPGEMVECGNCHTRQVLGRDAFARAKPEKGDGLGYVPGFPPGSGKKTLLFSSQRQDAPITAVPLDEPDSEPPLPDGLPPVTIPRPPERIAAGPPPIPDIPSGGVSAPRAGDAAEPDPVSTPTTTAIDVPAVTVELFGGGKPRSREESASGTLANTVLARVDDVPIYARDVERVVEPVLARMRSRQESDAQPDFAAKEKAFRREVLERLIDRELAIREAEAIGYKPEPNAVREREAELAQILAGTGVDVRREAVRDVTMADMRRRYAEKPGAVSPQAVRDFYKQNKDGMMQPRLVALDQLVVYEDRAGRPDARSYQDIAFEVSQALEQGGRFDDVRERYDEFGPSARIPHAEPTLLPESAYARQVLHMGGDLRKGAVFGPLFMEGMALFGKVTDERPEGPIPFEEVEKEIRRRLEAEAEEKNLDAWLQRLRQKSRVEIF